MFRAKCPPALQNLTEALLATFKKSVYPVSGIFEDQLLIKKQKKERGDFYLVPKRRIWLKLTFSNLLETLIRNT